MFDSDAEGGEQSPDGGGAIGPRRAVQVDQTRDGQKTITSDTCSAANIPRCQTIPGEPKNWRCRPCFTGCYTNITWQVGGRESGCSTTW